MKWLALVLTLCISLAQAQTLQLDSLNLTSRPGLGPDISRLEFELKTPAKFPAPESIDSYNFDCVGGLDAEEPQKAGIKVTPTSMQVGELKATCSGTKITVRHPKLFKAWSHTSNNPDLLLLEVADGSMAARWMRWSANKQLVAINLGGFDAAVLELKNGKIRVIDSRGNGAMSLSQGGKPQPLWISEQKSKVLSVNLKKPFTLHFTSDSGETWNNMTLDLAGNSVSRWSSLRVAGGTPVAKE